MVFPLVALGTMPPSSRELWSNNFILTPDRSRAASVSATPATRDELAKEWKERVAADFEKPRNTKPRPHVRRPETRPVSTRVTPRRTETTRWTRPSTTGRRERRDPSTPSHRHETDFDVGAIDSMDVWEPEKKPDAKTVTPTKKPPDASLSPRAQPPPLPPGHRAPVRGCGDWVQALGTERNTSATHREAPLPTAERFVCNSFSVQAQLVRERARVASLERALKITRVTNGVYTGGSVSTMKPQSTPVHDPVELSTQPEQEMFLEPAREYDYEYEKKPLLQSATSASNVWGFGEGSLKAGSGGTLGTDSLQSDFQQVALTSRMESAPFMARHDDDALRATAAATAAETVVAQNFDLETTLAQALQSSKRREFDAVTSEARLSGALRAAEARTTAAEARTNSVETSLANETKARRLAERDAAAARARAAVFEARLEELRFGRGRVFGERFSNTGWGVVLEVAQAQTEARGASGETVFEAFRVPASRAKPVPGFSRENGARRFEDERFDQDDDDVAFLDIPPEFDVDSGARGKSPRGRKQRGWAL